MKLTFKLAGSFFQLIDINNNIDINQQLSADAENRLLLDKFL
jgi:hypothetical protein